MKYFSGAGRLGIWRYSSLGTIGLRVSGFGEGSGSTMFGLGTFGSIVWGMVDSKEDGAGAVGNPRPYEAVEGVSVSASI